MLTLTTLQILRSLILLTGMIGPSFEFKSFQEVLSTAGTEEVSESTTMIAQTERLHRQT
jgi:hypothetical protein